jgi:hypothetical protein
MVLGRRDLAKLTIGAALTALTGCARGGGGSPDAPDRLQGPWDRFVAGSRREVDHAPLAVLLDRHVLKRSDGVHLFAYGDVTEAERANLDRYIRELAGFAVDSLDRREQYAFWLNLYNALVLRLVLSRYLVLSIQDIGFGLGPLGDGPFERELVAVLGRPVSLSDIRERILWPIFKDPRLHYGLCDAAIGAPNLQPRVFTGERVDRMLDGAALDYVNHPRGARLAGGRLILSEMYQSHLNHFGGTQAELLAHLRLYAVDPMRSVPRGVKKVSYAFDWSLNDGTGLGK